MNDLKALAPPETWVRSFLNFEHHGIIGQVIMLDHDILGDSYDTRSPRASWARGSRKPNDRVPEQRYFFIVTDGPLDRLTEDMRPNGPGRIHSRFGSYLDWLPAHIPSFVYLQPRRERLYVNVENSTF